MSENLKILSLLFILLIVIIITLFVRRDNISIKYSLIWYGALFILFLFTISPKLLIWITDLFKVQVSSNLVLALIIGILFIVSISLTIVVSKQKDQIKLLIQEVSLIKESVNGKYKKK